MAGSTGVIPAPKGYLKRLREITQKHGILLIFDEVITGYGRLGFAFAAERYGVLPDMLTFAKGITNGAAPMGGVLVRDTIHDAFMSGPEHMVEFTHGYTYSAHPIACAAGLATLDIYRDDKLFEHARAIEPKFADAVMSLKGLPNVLDIRTVNGGTVRATNSTADFNASNVNGGVELNGMGQCSNGNIHLVTRSQEFA